MKIMSSTSPKATRVQSTICTPPFFLYFNVHYSNVLFQMQEEFFAIHIKFIFILSHIHELLTLFFLLHAIYNT